jgi:hypothetical protein
VVEAYIQAWIWKPQSTCVHIGCLLECGVVECTDCRRGQVWQLAISCSNSPALMTDRSSLLLASVVIGLSH